MYLKKLNVKLALILSVSMVALFATSCAKADKVETIATTTVETVAETTIETAAVPHDVGKVVKPLYTTVDMNNLPDGIYNVSFTKDNIEKGTDNYITCNIYSQDIYDTVDLHQLKVGDTIEKGGESIKVTKIVWDADQSKMCLNYWDKIEDAAEMFIPMESGGTYTVFGPDDAATYTNRGKAKIKLSKNIVFTDNADLDNRDLKSTGVDAVIKAIENAKIQDFNCRNTTIRVEKGEAVEMNRIYTP